jgi:hypothetical protein
MIVPLGWMLDDRREPTLRLFKAPATDAPRPPQRRDRRARDDTGEQLRLDAALLARVDEDTGGPAEQPAVADDLPAASTVATDEAAGTAAETESGSDSPEPLPADRAWLPVFDPSDDLHGLLNARGRLLSRAFNGAPLDSG